MEHADNRDDRFAAMNDETNFDHASPFPGGSGREQTIRLAANGEVCYLFSRLAKSGVSPPSSCCAQYNHALSIVMYLMYSSIGRPKREAPPLQASQHFLTSSWRRWIDQRSFQHPGTKPRRAWEMRSRPWSGRAHGGAERPPCACTLPNGALKCGGRLKNAGCRLGKDTRFKVSSPRFGAATIPS